MVVTRIVSEGGRPTPEVGGWRETIDVSRSVRSDKGRSVTLLNPRFRFDSFIVGPANRFAHAAARRVAEDPGTTYNPLLVYGPSGSGKTHLLHAIGQAVRSGIKVRCVSMETMLEGFRRPDPSGRGASFGRDYDKCGLLLVDDVQVLAGHDALQGEVAQLVARLVHVRAQVVLVSGVRPGAIPILEDWMYRRFESGLTVDVQPPDWELRRAIADRRG